MIPDWASALVAKAKVAGLLGAALAAGGVGGSVALSHVTPTSQQVVASASSTSADPETTQAQDPETTQAQNPETTDAQAPAACPADVKNHGAYVSSVARSAPHGKGGVHGKAVSAAAKSDCGKDQTGAGSDDPESSDAESSDTDSDTDTGTRPTHTPPAHTPPANPHAKAHAHQH
jgi:hypothetical protein